MTAFRAFGSAAARQILRAELRARGPVYTAWLTHASIEGDLTPIAQEYGLHPALVRLLPALGAFGEDDGASAFYDALLEAIPVGADTGRLARHTVLLAWTDPVHGLARRIEAGPVSDACEAIAGLVRLSLDATVDKPAWRAARTRLTQAGQQARASEPVVELMLSMAWDLDHSPGAVQDVMRAWSARLSAEAEAADEDRFSEAETAFFQATMDRINSETFSALGMVDGAGDPDYAEFLEEVNQRWAADPDARAIRERAVARQGRVNARLAVWRVALRQKMLDEAATLAV